MKPGTVVWFDDPTASRARPFRASVPSLGDTGTPLPVEGIGLLAPPAAVPCLVCGSPSAPGDDLCMAHGGMEDGIARHAAMRAADLTTA